MYRIALLVVVLLFAGASSLAAETLSIVPGIALEVNLPGQKWQMSRQAPEFLVRETAEHLEHELADKGKQVDAESLKAEAGKRLAANELFIFNPDSGAVLTIDFSPLKEKEKAPRDRTVASSARYAGESLSSEEGIEGVESKTDKVKVAGAGSAYRVNASYRQHGDPMKFTGIIGFAEPYWFFFYYTDPLRDPGDAEEMGRILDALVLKPGGGN
ncbi:hypothetical protein [Desulfuromonas sp. TF]|uniref:hypothetical protein n=1 Tax=Desulfuromonas sp. TF TaxID=1232410 RepID=UPI00040B565C|nr:hypothetical protein [Desulfuromonas sp. TF]